ncbi:pantoate--beta-alanine ligase [Calditrichota bacterium]
MKVIDKISTMQDTAKSLHRRGKSIGLIPTMGYLHEGHLSLIRIAKKKADIAIVSIFVNPTQFAPNEDYEKYPRDLQKDERLCEQEGVDIIFYPHSGDMYPPDHKTFVLTEDLSNKLCGISRPIHFRGVTTVVAKLFNIVQPDIAVFGQKDAQQNLIIRKMVADLNFDIKIIKAPIIREFDGLAMSSRNRYLSPTQRQDALVIYNSLQKAKQLTDAGEINVSRIKEKIYTEFSSISSAKIDYVAVVDYQNLIDLDIIKDNTLIAIAAYFGKTRLIDNIIINISSNYRR